MFRPYDSFSTALSLDLWDRHYCNINWKAANKPFWFLPSIFAQPSKSSSSTKKKKKKWHFDDGALTEEPQCCEPKSSFFLHGCGELSIFKIKSFLIQGLVSVHSLWVAEVLWSLGAEMWPLIIYLLASLSAFWVLPLGSKWISSLVKLTIWWVYFFLLGNIKTVAQSHCGHWVREFAPRGMWVPTSECCVRIKEVNTCKVLRIVPGTGQGFFDFILSTLGQGLWLQSSCLWQAPSALLQNMSRTKPFTKDHILYESIYMKCSEWENL